MNKPKDNETIFITDSILKRFWEKVEKTDSCWIWKSPANRSGYGVIKIQGSNRSCHRISYAIKFGEIPENLFVLHKCHNKKCVNPDHLYIGTNKDNSNDEVLRKNTRHYKCGNPSKFNGVRWCNSRKNWISYVYINSKIIDIGRHISEVDAARNHDRIKYMKYGISENLNFPEEYEINP